MSPGWRPGRSSLLRGGSVAGVLLLAALLRFHHLGANPLWLDEGYSLRFSEEPLSVLWSEQFGFDTNPPLYYSLLHLWRVFGDSETTLRALSALFGVLHVALFYAWGRTLGGHGLGLVAASLLAASPMHVKLAQQARTYALLHCATTLALWSLSVLLLRPREASRPVWRRAPREAGGPTGQPRRGVGLAWAGLVLGSVVSIYAHNTAVLMVVLTNLIALAALLRVPALDRGFLGNWILAQLCILAGYAWYLPILYQQSVYGIANLWVPEPTLDYVRGVFDDVYGHRRLWRWRPWIDLAWWGLVGLGVWTWRRRPLHLLLTLGIGAGLPLLMLGVSQWRPILIPRVLVWSTTGILLLLAAGLRPWRRPAVAGLVALALLAVQLRELRSWYQGPGFREPWREAASIVAADQHPGDAIGFLARAADWTFSYYLPGPADARFRLVNHRRNQDPRRERLSETRTVTVDELDAVFESHRRVWLVARYGGPFRREQVEDIVAEHARRGFATRSWDLKKLQVVRLEAPH